MQKKSYLLQFFLGYASFSWGFFSWAGEGVLRIALRVSYLQSSHFKGLYDT